MSEIKNFRNYLLNYKSKITFKETNAKELVSEITAKYNCVDITDSFLRTTKYKMYADNYLYRYGDSIDSSGVCAYEIIKDLQSSGLEAYDEEDDIYFVVENEHCFFETNCGELFYEMSLLRSVTLYDYINNTEALFELLSVIAQREG